MTPYKDPPETLRQAIENAVEGTTISFRFDREFKESFIALIQVHVEDYLATEFTKLAYDTDHVKGLIHTLKKRVLLEDKS